MYVLYYVLYMYNNDYIVNEIHKQIYEKKINTMYYFNYSYYNYNVFFMQLRIHNHAKIIIKCTL